MTTCSIVSACSQVALLVPDYLDSQEMENLEACGNSAESLIPMVITQTASLLQTEAVRKKKGLTSQETERHWFKERL